MDNQYSFTSVESRDRSGNLSVAPATILEKLSEVLVDPLVTEANRIAMKSVTEVMSVCRLPAA